MANIAVSNLFDRVIKNRTRLYNCFANNTYDLKIL